MMTVQARRLVRHVKAALLHLRAAENIAGQAGVDLVADPWENEPARDLIGASRRSKATHPTPDAIALPSTEKSLRHNAYNVSSGRPFTNRKLVPAHCEF
jgi:hypothetical protein